MLINVLWNHEILEFIFQERVQKSKLSYKTFHSSEGNINVIDNLFILSLEEINKIQEKNRRTKKYFIDKFF